MEKMVVKFEVKVPKDLIEKLKIYKEQFKDIEAEIARAERAGLDVGELKARLRMAKERVTKILEVYGKQR